MKMLKKGVIIHIMAPILKNMVPKEELTEEEKAGWSILAGALKDCKPIEKEVKTE